jgi:hypothetical protein
MISNPYLFATSDIDLVACLIGEFTVVDTQPSPSNVGRVIFYFEETQEIKDYVANYRAKLIRVEPKAYYHQLRDVRSRINDTLDSQEL